MGDEEGRGLRGPETDGRTGNRRYRKKERIDKETVGNTFVAADVVGAGIGEQVLTVSGSTARKAFGRDTVPVDAAIVAIIDTVEVNREAARGSE